MIRRRLTRARCFFKVRLASPTAGIPPAVTQLPHRSNNFDLIRLLAAVQVVLSHAVGHTDLIHTIPPWAKTLFEYMTWLPGVPVFFVISGFLIARSYERSRGDPLGYAWRRSLRIFPALWVCLGVTLIVLAAAGFLTGEFIRSATFPAWLAGQLTFVQFFNPGQFREFGIGVANGALWTITVELQFYVFIPILYATVFGIWNHRRTGRLVFGTIFAASFILFCFMDAKVNGPGGYSEAPIFWKLLFVTLAPHVWMFMLGIWIHRHFAKLRHLIEGRFLYYLAAYLLFMFVRDLLFDPASPAFYFCYLPSRLLLAFGTISAAYSAPWLSGKLLRGADISYGIYIYHSIVINVLVELGRMDSMLAVFWVLVLSGTLALLSWIFVEKPALSCKSIAPGLPRWRRKQPETLS